MNPSISKNIVVLCLLILVRSAAACGDGQASITNIPTLGGSGIQLYAVNARAQVTGSSDLPGNTATHAYISSGGATRDLSTLGGPSSYAYSINNMGHVVGEAYVANGYSKHAFLYDGVQMHDLGTLGGGSDSMAVGINDAGQIAGMSLKVYEGVIEAFIYDNGSMRGLGDLGGGGSFPVAINQHGVIAGNSYTASWENHGFIFIDSNMKDLGTLGGGSSSVSGLNNNNMVVGESTTATGETHAFLYKDGTMNDIKTLGGNYSSAWAINDAGQVIGVSTRTDGSMWGFVYYNEVITDLGSLGGRYIEPFAINNSGQIVGTSETAAGELHGFLWQNGVMVDLNTLVLADSGWIIASAEFVTDTGLIVGTGSCNGVSQPYILSLSARNTAPVSVAGPDQLSECQSSVTLDGSGSYDADGDQLAFEWSLGGEVVGIEPRLQMSFPKGANLVTLKVTDPCGEFSESVVTVTISDTQPPVVTCPPPVTVAADSQCQSRIPDVRSLLVVADNCTPPERLVIVQDPTPGSVVGAGSHTVVVTVTDESGNSSQCSTLCTVTDQSPPQIVTLPPTRIKAGADARGIVPNMIASAQDNCSGANELLLTQSPAPGTLLPVGSYVVSVTATDAAGNQTSENVSLTVEDKTAPVVVAVSVTPAILTPPNHQMVPVCVSVETSDNCDGSPVSRIVRVVSNEPIVPGEVQITGKLTALLAATRSPSGEGRTYALQLETVDVSGNITRSSVEVIVPKGNGNGSCLDTNVKDKH